MTEEGEDCCGDPDSLCVYNGCSLAFWSFFVILFELILSLLSFPFSTFEAIVHAIQIILLLIGLFGLSSGCCYHHLVRFHAIMSWPLTAITILSLFHYSEQLTPTEIADALSFYFPGIELVVAYIIGVMEPFGTILLVAKFFLLWSYGWGSVVAMFGWQNAASAQLIYFDTGNLDTWIGIIVYLLTIFLGVDLEDLGHITSAKQLVQKLFVLAKSVLTGGGLGAKFQALSGSKKKNGKGSDDVHATWHRASNGV